MIGPAGMAFDPAAVAFDPASGLVVGVVQDIADGQVLMVGWLDREALEATIATGEVHFHSRSRDRLWRKGETSGNVLHLRSIALDCDADAVLLGVEPAGPTCHRGTRSCFDGTIDAEATNRAPAGGPATGSPPQGFASLEPLWTTIAERARTRPAGSYTADLLAGGVDAIGRKVLEEATEVLLAARDDAEVERAGTDRATTRSALAAETADLLYHVLVLVAERGAEPREALAILASRRR